MATGSRTRGTSTATARATRRGPRHASLSQTWCLQRQTHSHGPQRRARRGGDVSIIAGNARPEVSFKAPVDGRFADLKGRIPFKVAVKDRGAGTVDCTKVKVTYSLGHNEHAHPQGAIPVRRDCTGVYRPRPEAGNDPTAAYVYHVLEASYTDGGGDGKAPALTGSADLVLHPTEYAAAHLPGRQGRRPLLRRALRPGLRRLVQLPPHQPGRHRSDAAAGVAERHRSDGHRSRGSA